MTTRRSSSGSNAMLVVGTNHALTQAAPCCSSLRTWAWGWGRGWGHGLGARLLQLPARHPFVARDERQRGHEREKHPVDAGQEGGGEARPRVGRVVAESEEEEARLGVAGTRARQIGPQRGRPQLLTHKPSRTHKRGSRRRRGARLLASAQGRRASEAAGEAATRVGRTLGRQLGGQRGRHTSRPMHSCRAATSCTQIEPRASRQARAPSTLT